MGFNVAVVGATGAVGQAMREILEERNFPVDSIRLFASHRSAGTKIEFGGKTVVVEDVAKSDFKGIEIALFSAGGGTSLEYAPKFAEAGAVVIDNSSAWRMDEACPLVVPEVNPQDAHHRPKGIIANPNCSTIQMVVALKPIHDAAKIKRVVVATYQAAAGAGGKGQMELEAGLRSWAKDEPHPNKVFVHPLPLNLIPQIDVFLENGFTKEEMKMVNETKKIMGDDGIQVCATCVRVPVAVGHSESVNIECEKKITAEEAKKLLAAFPGIVLQDDPAKSVYPLPVEAAGKDPVYVGRVREDLSVPNGLVMWVVADNLRKGAALNAVQIAELLIDEAESGGKLTAKTN